MVTDLQLLRSRGPRRCGSESSPEALSTQHDMRSPTHRQSAAPARPGIKRDCGAAIVDDDDQQAHAARNSVVLIADAAEPRKSARHATGRARPATGWRSETSAAEASGANDEDSGWPSALRRCRTYASPSRIDNGHSRRRAGCAQYRTGISRPSAARPGQAVVSDSGRFSPIVTQGNPPTIHRECR